MEIDVSWTAFFAFMGRFIFVFACIVWVISVRLWLTGVYRVAWRKNQPALNENQAAAFVVALFVTAYVVAYLFAW